MASRLSFKKVKRPTLPMAPSVGGSYGKTLETSREVANQDEPTDAHLVSAHKQMAGNKDPGRIKGIT